MSEDLQTSDPETNASQPVPALPVLPYRAPKDEPANGPSSRGIMAATVSLTVALFMLGGAVTLFVYVLMSAREGVIFGAILLLFPLAICLLAAKSAFATTARYLRGDPFTYAVRRPNADREWGDIFIGIFIFAAKKRKKRNEASNVSCGPPDPRHQLSGFDKPRA